MKLWESVAGRGAIGVTQAPLTGVIISTSAAVFYSIQFEMWRGVERKQAEREYFRKL